MYISTYRLRFVLQMHHDQSRPPRHYREKIKSLSCSDVEVRQVLDKLVNGQVRRENRGDYQDSGSSRVVIHRSHVRYACVVDRTIVHR